VEARTELINVGLVPKQEDSEESQPQLGISKAGDIMLRKPLVGRTHYILGRFGSDTDLRRYGLRLCCSSGSAEAGGLAAPTLGEWRSL